MTAQGQDLHRRSHAISMDCVDDGVAAPPDQEQTRGGIHGLLQDVWTDDRALKSVLGSRSLRRALLTPQLSPGSLYRCGRSTSEQPVWPRQEEKGGLKPAPTRLVQACSRPCSSSFRAWCTRQTPVPVPRTKRICSTFKAQCRTSSPRSWSCRWASVWWCRRVLGSWGRAMRGAVRSKERRKGRRAPTQDPST